MSETHVHDCTGPDMRCPCGYVFTVPRFSVSFDVWDNDTKRHLVDDIFSTDAIGAAVSALRRAADKLEGQ
jgi:hypothetical protein